MGKTLIEWAEYTVNAVNGCSVTSPGCTNCYAMRLAGTRMKHHPTREGLTRDTRAGPVWTGDVRLHEPALLQPLKWKRPRRIFWNAHGDLFHENVPDAWIDRVFAVCALTPQHTHMILTKRAARMREYLTGADCDGARRFHVADAAGHLVEDGDNAHDYVAAGVAWPLPNAWLGVSVEDQTRADERIPDLLATPAAVRFLSCEPLLGSLDLEHLTAQPEEPCWRTVNALSGEHGHGSRLGHTGTGIFGAKIDWVIVGGESGPGARPMHPDWARSLRDQCADAGVPFHFKQWGEWISVYDRDRDDPDWRSVPKPGDWDRKRWLNLANGQGFHGDKLNMMRRVGKKRAGRLLDGVEHNGMPIPHSSSRT